VLAGLGWSQGSSGGIRTFGERGARAKWLSSTGCAQREARSKGADLQTGAKSMLNPKGWR